MKGYKIIIGLLAIGSLANLIMPFIKPIEQQQGTLTALIVLGLSGYLLVREYKIN